MQQLTIHCRYHHEFEDRLQDVAERTDLRDKVKVSLFSYC